jgi:hypothetical protein
MAELENMSDEQMRRGGRWRGSGGALEISYLTGIPYDFLRLAGGYQGEGSVFVVRAEHPPPPELIKQVFPFATTLRSRCARLSGSRLGCEGDWAEGD